MRDIIDVYIVKSNFFWKTVKLFFSEKEIFSENFFTIDSFSKSTLIDRSRIRLDSAHLNLRQQTTVPNKHFQNVEVIELHIGCARVGLFGSHNSSNNNKWV